jgi:chain length determinant protein tyrosine kinase EpsG
MATLRKAEQHHDRSAPRPMLIGELLQSAGVLSSEDVGRVVALQQQRGLRFGEAAIALGLLQVEDLHRGLSRQFDYPFVRVGESGLDSSLYVAYAPFSSQSEALRKLRSQLLLHWGAEGKRVLAVSGARKNSGCSRVAANLAIAFSQLGERTLLIDGDLRRPRQHQLFGLSMGEGLGDLLGGRGTMAQAIMPVPAFPHLALLGAGAGVPNPQELLSRVGFAYLMQTLPSSFDVIIVDTPPVLEFADAQLIATHTHNAVLVARQHQTRLADVDDAKVHLQSAGTQLLGAVLNQA